MNKLTPYIMLNGNCEEALAYYVDYFEGTIGFMGKYKDSPMDILDKDKEKIMHADFSFWGGHFFASDHIGNAEFTTFSPESNIHLMLSFDNLDELKKTFEMLASEGSITLALDKTFWGDIFGMVKDKYGIQWMMNFREGEK